MLLSKLVHQNFHFVSVCFIFEP